MKLEQRIRKLEEKTSKTHPDPSSDEELTEWFKLHPSYSLFTQPENNNGIVMPGHLSFAFKCRIDRLLRERGLSSSLCSLLEISKDLF